jgi:hypothetical protein
MAESTRKHRPEYAIPARPGSMRGGRFGPPGRAARLDSLAHLVNGRSEVRQLAARGEALSSARARPGPSPSPSGGARLPPALQQGVESLSGLSLDDVTVHRNSSLPAELGAFAYARGTDIHLGPGQEGQMPHEAWHVVQQKQGRVRPTLQLKGAAVNDDSGLEGEADRKGAEAARLADRTLPDGNDVRGYGELGEGRAPGATVQLNGDKKKSQNQKKQDKIKAAVKGKEKSKAKKTDKLVKTQRTYQTNKNATDEELRANVSKMSAREFKKARTGHGSQTSAAKMNRGTEGTMKVLNSKKASSDDKAQTGKEKRVYRKSTDKDEKKSASNQTDSRSDDDTDTEEEEEAIVTEVDVTETDDRSKHGKKDEDDDESGGGGNIGAEVQAQLVLV